MSQQQLTIGLRLAEKQREFMAAVASGLYRFMALGGGIRSGKTFTMLIVLVTLMWRYPRSRWAIVRKDLPTLRRNTIPSIDKIRAMTGGWLGPLKQVNWTYTAANGSELILMPESLEQDPELERFKGFECNGFLLEEASELSVKTKDKAIERAGSYIIPPDEKQMARIIEAVAKGADYEKALRELGPEQPPPRVFFTFNPADNWVRSDFYEKHRRGQLKAPWFYLPATIVDNPFLPDEYKESLKSMRAAEYEKFVKGIWGDTAAPNQLISMDDIEYAASGEIPFIDGTIREALDVARYGLDSSVFARIRGNSLVELESYEKKDTHFLSIRARQRINEGMIDPRNYGIDVVGVGAGCADNLIAWGYNVREFISGAKPVPRPIIGLDPEATPEGRRLIMPLLQQLDDPFLHSTFKFKDRRSQAWWEFAHKIKYGMRRIEVLPDELRADLTAVRYEIRDKVVMVQPKEDVAEYLGRSPDWGDAVVMADFEYEGELLDFIQPSMSFGALR